MVAKRKAQNQQNPTSQRAGAIWEVAFLRILRREGNVSASCRAAKIDRSTVYDHRNADPAFAALWDKALEEASDHLEKEAWRRATKGTRKPIYYQGKRVGYEREYSDVLLLALLKGNRPDKFKERVQQEVSGPDGGAIQIKGVNYRSAIAPLAPGSVGDSDPSGEGEGSGNG
jgi:hypothetical protein